MLFGKTHVETCEASTICRLETSDPRLSSRPLRSSPRQSLQVVQRAVRKVERSVSRRASADLALPKRQIFDWLMASLRADEMTSAAEGHLPERSKIGQDGLETIER